MPDDQAVEKVNLLTALGATVERVRRMRQRRAVRLCDCASR
jgi:cysteine synthase